MLELGLIALLQLSGMAPFKKGNDNDVRNQKEKIYNYNFVRYN